MDVWREQPYFVADGEFDSFMFGIVVLGFLILSGFEMFNKIVMEVSELLGERLRCRNWDIVASEVDGKSGMIAVIGVERGAIDAGLVGVIICELGDGQEIEPIVLLTITIYAEILFNDLIHAFGLAISLRMK